MGEGYVTTGRVLDWNSKNLILCACSCTFHQIYKTLSILFCHIGFWSTWELWDAPRFEFSSAISKPAKNDKEVLELELDFRAIFHMRVRHATLWVFRCHSLFSNQQTTWFCFTAEMTKKYYIYISIELGLVLWVYDLIFAPYSIWEWDVSRCEFSGAILSSAK